MWYRSVHAKLITVVLDYLYWARCCGIGLFMLSSLLRYCLIYAVLVAEVSSYLSCAYPCDIWLYWLNKLLLLVGDSIVWSSITEEEKKHLCSSDQLHSMLFFWLAFCEAPCCTAPACSSDLGSPGSWTLPLHRTTWACYVRSSSSEIHFLPAP